MAGPSVRKLWTDGPVFVMMEVKGERSMTRRGPSFLKWRETLPYVPVILALCLGVPWLLRQLEGSGMPLLSGAIYAQVLLPIGCLAVGMFLGKRRGFCPLYPVLCGAGTFAAVFLLYHHDRMVLLLFCGIAVAFSLLGVAAGAWPREEKKGRGGG